MSDIDVNHSALLNTHARELKPGTPPLSQDVIAKLLPSLNGWSIDNGRLSKVFKFKNFHDTMAFVNALAWVSHRENHHPDLEVGYDTCAVRYVTHSVGGLSENDFYCAAKVDAL